MMLLPRSLLGRTALIITALLLVAQGLTAYVFRLYYYGPVVDEAAARAASQIGVVVSAMRVLHEEEREEFLDTLEAREQVRVLYDSAGMLPAREPEGAFMRAFAARLRAAVGTDTEFFSAGRDSLALWVKVPMATETLWIGIPRTQIERPFPWWWMGGAALCALVAVLAAYALLYRVGRPLRALAEASADLAAGRQPEPVKEEGPAEVRDVAHAFNGMLRDLRRQEEDRAVLLAGISHDLRTPLTRLRLGVELLQGDAATKADIVRDTDEMNVILGQFLDFARRSSQEPFVTASLNELVAGCCAAYADRDRRLTLSPGREANVRVQPIALRRALTNLIENAYKYSTGPISVRTERRDGQVMICVLDSGAGIPPAEIERVLLPFTRLESARTGAQGAGLGLAIAQQVMRAQGGGLRLSNRQEGGLSACLVLPVLNEVLHGVGD